MNTLPSSVSIAAIVDLELELLIAILPHRRPSDLLDARIALRTQSLQVNP
jgi:hypothetical protein